MTTFDESFAGQAEHIHHTILDNLSPAEAAARAFIVAEVGEDHGPAMSMQARGLVEAIKPHLYREVADRFQAEVPAKWVIQLLNEWAAEMEAL